MKSKAAKFLEKVEKLENFVITMSDDGISEFLKHVKKYHTNEYKFLEQKQLLMIEKLNEVFKTGVNGKNKFFNFFSVFVSNHGKTIHIQIDQYKNIDKSYSFDMTRPPDGRLTIRIIRKRRVYYDEVEDMELETVEVDSWFPIKVKTIDDSKDSRIDDSNKKHNGFFLILDLDTDDKPVDEMMYHLETGAYYIIEPFIPKKSEKFFKSRKKKN